MGQEQAVDAGASEMFDRTVHVHLVFHEAVFQHTVQVHERRLPRAEFCLQQFLVTHGVFIAEHELAYGAQPHQRFTGFHGALLCGDPWGARGSTAVGRNRYGCAPVRCGLPWG